MYWKRFLAQQRFILIIPSLYKFEIFENFLYDTLNSEQKLSLKNRSTGPVRNRSTGNDFEIYRSGRVEKTLTGSISGLKFKFQAGQIEHSVAKGLPPRRHLFEMNCVAWAQRRGDGPR